MLAASIAVMMINRFIMGELPSRLPTCAALRTTLKIQTQTRSVRASSSAPLVPFVPSQPALFEILRSGCLDKRDLSIERNDVRP